jgi:hypothetical protein
VLLPVLSGPIITIFLSISSDGGAMAETRKCYFLLRVAAGVGKAHEGDAVQVSTSSTGRSETTMLPQGYLVGSLIIVSPIQPFTPLLTSPRWGEELLDY